MKNKAVHNVKLVKRNETKAEIRKKKVITKLLKQNYIDTYHRNSNVSCNDNCESCGERCMD